MYIDQRIMKSERNEEVEVRTLFISN